MQERMINNPKFSGENPFDVPEGYFETMEDRVEERIRTIERKSFPGQKLILMAKPALGLAASFALAFLLIYYPINKILPWYIAGHADGKAMYIKFEEQLLNDYGSLDEGAFFLALTSQEDPDEFKSDEIISFLSSELDDYEVYSEIIN